MGAPGALESETYLSDFTAFVSSGPCKCLRLTRAQFLAAVNASAYERQSNSNVGGGDSKYTRRMSNSQRTNSARGNKFSDTDKSHKAEPSAFPTSDEQSSEVMNLPSSRFIRRMSNPQRTISGRGNKFNDADKSHKAEPSAFPTSDKPSEEVMDLPSSPAVSSEVETSGKKELIAETRKSKFMAALQSTNDSKDSRFLGLLGASTAQQFPTQTTSSEPLTETVASVDARKIDDSDVSAGRPIQGSIPSETSASEDK